MKLIDTDKLIEDLYLNAYACTNDEANKILHKQLETNIEVINNQATAFDVNNIVKKLEKLADELEEKALTMNKAECFDFANGLLSKAIGVRDAIDIIKVGGIDEVNN